jgi:AraC-like DNA-binding protein
VSRSVLRIGRMEFLGGTPTAETQAEKQRLAREDRHLRQIALARLIEDRIAAGEFASLADVARRCGVSRARVSQVSSVTPIRPVG